MGRREPLRLGPEAWADHPALTAWRALGGSEPRAVVVLKEESGSERKSRVYRLEGAAPAGAVVAKRCPSEAAAIEQAIYAELLARLPLPALRCHGVVADADPRWAWLFVAGGEGAEFDAGSPDHRACAGAWLAALHVGAEALPALERLPERGPEHYLAQLRAGRRRIAESFENPALLEADRELLDAILRGLDLVEASWDDVAEACREAPRTLVHCDFADRNVRIDGRGPHAPAWVFDWELAGRGVPGVDLLHADLDVYAAAVGAHWPRLDVPQQARVGRLLRGALAPIEWESLGLAWPWVERPLRNLARYRQRLEAALAEWGMTPGRRRSRSARMPEAAASDPRAHPAVCAWRRLGRADAGLVSVELLRRKTAAQVYRLRGIGPGGGHVVAKRLAGATAEVERSVYERALPRLPLRMPGYFGALAEPDACWLFLEDAGDEQVEGPEARALLGEWVARFHTAASVLADELALPDEGTDRQRTRLREAGATLRAHLGNPALAAADRWVLRGLIGSLEGLDVGWARVEALCARMPRTLVHGDLGASNLRLRRADGGAEVLVLDWETAGVGPPAIDLFGVDLERYAAGVAHAWPWATPEEVARWQRCGVLLRAIVATAWEAPELAHPWVERPMARLRIYRGELEAGLAALALEPEPVREALEARQ
jgi:aminoglycoside phosphotransferase (APT) family kinase protein